MGKVFDEITPALDDWINAQKMFFVATAPRADDGLVNCSPKGLLDTFAIINPKTVAYLDLTGSGIETVAHLRENGRIVVLFCAFEGPPKIVRLHGRGDVLEPGDPEFSELRSCFGEYPGVRSIIRIKLNRISDSCGYAVPLYTYKKQRPTLITYAEKKGKDGMAAYRRQKNRTSLDGLPGLNRLEEQEDGDP